MRKLPITLIGLLLLTVCAGAAAYNYAAGRVPVGTFTNGAAAVDGSLATSAVSGNVADSPQILTIDMGTSIYVGSVKVSWDSKALSRNYSIRVSNDTKNWITEFSALDAAKGAADTGSGVVSQIVSMRRYTSPARFVQIYMPVGSSATASQVKIADIQILPAEGLSFKIEEVKPYAVGDKKAIIVYRTSIGAAKGQVLYGRNPAKLDKMAVNMESGAINSVTLTDLEPGLVYFYKVKAWSAYGAVAESDAMTLRPASSNVALGRPVTGTFTQLPPNDPLVDQRKNVLSRCVDGVTGYFKGMATSGSLTAADQQVTIDLGASYPINSIVCYWRALAYPEDYSVRLSGDKVNWKDISKLNAGEGAFARSDAGDPLRVVNAAGNGESARYVQVLIKKGSPYYAKHANWDFVQLAEVEVYPK
jgi:hypothetical protein